jgi:hypothetical protein
MPKFEVQVFRTSYSSRMIEVEAENEEEAKENALEKAGDYEFSEKDAEYTVDFVTKKEGE